MIIGANIRYLCVGLWEVTFLYDEGVSGIRESECEIYVTLAEALNAIAEYWKQEFNTFQDNTSN